MSLSRFENFQLKRLHLNVKCEVPACKVQRCVPLKNDPLCVICEENDYELSQLPKGVEE